LASFADNVCNPIESIITSAARNVETRTILLRDIFLSS